MLPATSTSRRKYRRDELAMLMKERKYADGSGSSRRSDECANCQTRDCRTLPRTTISPDCCLRSGLSQEECDT